MRTNLAITLFVFVAVTTLVSEACARNTQGKTISDYRFIEMPTASGPAADLDLGSMYQAAAAGTTVLAWWQFDTVSGAPWEQGWTKIDINAQLDTFFHVDGTGAAGPECCPITPISGQKSMWCGKCPSTEEPYCGWATLPGSGNGWDQSLESQSFICTTLTFSYTAVWDSEQGYDFTYAQYWDATLLDWVDLPVDGGTGFYDGDGGPLFESFVINPPDAWTKLRFHFVSDGAWSDEDGLWPTDEGAFKVDDITVSCPDVGGSYNYFEDWEDEPCGGKRSNDSMWQAKPAPSFGIYAALHSGAAVVQEDPCRILRSSVWGFFDDPANTNYACGGWPLQGAMPYGPDENGLYLMNEIWSPWVANAGSGDKYIFGFTTYRDLPLDNLQFYMWHITTKDVVTNCPGNWEDYSFVYYGGQKDWRTSNWDVSVLVGSAPDSIRVALGGVDMCRYWCGIYGTGACHSHAPLFDQVRLLRVDVQGPQLQVRHIDLFQDNFPEDGTITGTARADIAIDILPNRNGGILPGDTITANVVDAGGLALDPTFGGAAVYCYVRVGTNGPPPIPPKSGLVIQSPDVRPANTPNPGTIRYPWVGDIPCGGNTWSQFRMDTTFSVSGHEISDRYCFDLMDIANGKHVNEDQIANVGVFTPGDTIWYFFGAQNAVGQWSYWHRTSKGQGASRTTFNIAEACENPCEFSILPDAGRLPGDDGDILYVDDADDRGGPAQLHFDNTFDWLAIKSRVDRYDVLGPSSAVGNSLASRVQDVFAQIIGDPIEIYQKIVWCSSDLSSALIGDGGPENGGSGPEKSDDFSLLNTFLTNHPANPGVYVSGDDIADEWSTMTGAGAIAVRSTYMNYILLSGNHVLWGEPVSPTVWSGNPGSHPVFDPPQSPNGPDALIAFGGCPVINDFDVLEPTGLSKLEMDYPISGDAAVLAQATTTAQTTARFVLSGFAYNYIRETMLPGQPVPIRVEHLRDILIWFENVIPEPVGIDALAFENRLENNYPNPFNPTTTIEYSIKEPGHVSLRIYNAAGQLVRTLVDDIQTPKEGGFSKEWNGLNDQGQPVSSGVYFYRLSTKGFSQTKKMVLLK